MDTSKRISHIAMSAIVLVTVLLLGAPTAMAAGARQASLTPPASVWTCTHFVQTDPVAGAVLVSFWSKDGNVVLTQRHSLKKSARVLRTRLGASSSTTSSGGVGAVGAVPEPGAMSLYVAGLLVVGAAQRRLRKR